MRGAQYARTFFSYLFLYEVVGILHIVGPRTQATIKISTLLGLNLSHSGMCEPSISDYILILGSSWSSKYEKKSSW